MPLSTHPSGNGAAGSDGGQPWPRAQHRKIPWAGPGKRGPDCGGRGRPSGSHAPALDKPRPPGAGRKSDRAADAPLRRPAARQHKPRWHPSDALGEPSRSNGIANRSRATLPRFDANRTRSQSQRQLSPAGPAPTRNRVLKRAPQRACAPQRRRACSPRVRARRPHLPVPYS